MLIESPVNYWQVVNDKYLYEAYVNHKKPEPTNPSVKKGAESPWPRELDYRSKS